MGKGVIAGQWANDDSDRQSGLERARLCAALTDPPILPPIGQTPDSKLPENYQSVGSRGAMTMEGKFVAFTWTPGIPWFHLDVRPDILYDPSIPPADIQRAQQTLYLHELLIQSVLESSGMSLGGNNRGGTMGFLTGKRDSIAQTIVTGDALEMMTKDYRLKVFRRDQYVTCRDSGKDVLYHTVKECIDPKSLPEEQQQKAKFTTDLLNKSVKDRKVDIYTHCEWQPESKTWVIKQECNGWEIATSEEPVSSFFSTPFRLVAGENYGRGFVELNLGDLRSLNTLSLRELEFAAQASKFVPVRDYTSETRIEDLSKPSGEPISARVVSGVVQDLAFLQTNKGADFAIVFQKSMQLRKDLGTAFLMDADTIPQKERVTAAQVNRLGQELDAATGGASGPIADSQQTHTLARTVYQLNRDALLPKLPEKAVRFRVTTGIAALGRAANANKLLTFAQTIAPFPGLLARIDEGVFLNVLARYQNIYEPGLIKTDEQVAKDQQLALDQQTQMVVREQVAKTAGDVITKAAPAA